jgi:hypothetical protein
MARAALVFPLLAVVLAGCVVVSADHPAVPLLPAEQVPVPPPSKVTLIWQPGHFDWDGTNYILVQGAWVDRAGHGTLWQDGYWQPAKGTSVWVAAHWL